MIDFDSVEGIQACLGSYEKLCELIYARQHAGYTAGMCLQEVYILGGKILLDTSGNAGLINSYDTAKLPANLPNVLHRMAFWDKAGRFGVERLNYTMNAWLPTPNAICPECEEGWAIENCLDHLHECDSMTVSGSNFVGKTLAAIEQEICNDHGKLWRLVREVPIRNDRFIDLSLEYPDTDQEWQKGLVKNEHGWARAREHGIDDSYVVQAGDEMYFNVHTWMHRGCHTKRLARATEADFRDAFAKAGYTLNAMDAVENQYGSSEYNGPWFRALTDVGTVTIGWRKRIINIDTSELCEEGWTLNLELLFVTEEVTKSNTNIHAWGMEKAVEYLAKIRETILAER